tara:strand:+ start:1277 stop:1720 length:444 start_codon:yes stop_codon:yes gene_type:complete
MNDGLKPTQADLNNIYDMLTKVITMPLKNVEIRGGSGNYKLTNTINYYQMFEPDSPIITWWNYHQENPEVYELFKRFTFEAIRSGKTRYSAWGIIHRIRWHTDMETTGSEYKISNNNIAYYSRLFMEDYPQYEGFFQTKKMDTDIPF